LFIKRLQPALDENGTGSAQLLAKRKTRTGNMPEATLGTGVQSVGGLAFHAQLNRPPHHKT